MKGMAQRGNQLAFGSFGLKTLENCWLTAQQIEAARTSYTCKRNRFYYEAEQRGRHEPSYRHC